MDVPLLLLEIRLCCPFQRTIRVPLSQCPVLLGGTQRLTRREIGNREESGWPRRNNLSQPGFLWPSDQSCLVVMPLQHSHSDPHDPVIVLGMSAKLSDTNYYN